MKSTTTFTHPMGGSIEYVPNGGYRLLFADGTPVNYHDILTTPKQAERVAGLIGLPLKSTAKYTCQCTHRDGRIGCWLFEGDEYKTGTDLSPIFPSLGPLFDWMREFGWESIPNGVWAARRINIDKK